jgi:agmatinase
MLDLHLLDRNYGFMGSIDQYDEAKVVILGVPLEATLSFRPGTRFGPQQIRNVSVGLEEFSVYRNRDLTEVAFFDAGDVAFPYGNVEESLRLIEQAATQIIRDQKKPIFIGGEHLVSYPLIKAAAAQYPELVVLHFDAHADLRPDYLGQELSHATVMRQVVTKCLKPNNLYQFGIRSGTREEFKFAQEHTNLSVEAILDPLTSVLPRIKECPLYLSIDIDVADPAFAPGTGTPEPGGCTSRELISVIHALQGLNLIGMDIVEVSPMNDVNDQTSLLAAKLIREAILTFW